MINSFGKAKFLSNLEANWSRLYRMAFAWSHDEQIALDIVQETISKALENRKQLKQADSMDAWLFKILANCWYDVCRKKKRLVELSEAGELVLLETPESSHDRSELINMVHRAMAKLSIEQRQIVSLVDLEGMSYSEVGEVLEIPIGTVMSRLCRARNNLKKILEDFESDRSRQESNIWRIK